MMQLHHDLKLAAHCQQLGILLPAALQSYLWLD